MEVSGNFINYGTYVDVHDNDVVNLSIDGGEVKVKKGQRDEQLKTGQAEQLMSKLVEAGILTAEWQPVGLSGPERGLVAKAVCDRLGIERVWQVFGLLWGDKPETLRTYFNKALELKKSLEFQDNLKNILD
jgi:hypothetical protein